MNKNEFSDEEFWEALIKQFFVAIEKYHESKNIFQKRSYYENAKFFFEHIEMELGTKKVASKELKD